MTKLYHIKIGTEVKPGDRFSIDDGALGNIYEYIKHDAESICMKVYRKRTGVYCGIMWFDIKRFPQIVTHSRYVPVEGPQYHVEEYKIWKGIDATKPTWQSINLCFDTYEGAASIIEYIEGNALEKVLRVKLK